MAQGPVGRPSQQVMQTRVYVSMSLVTTGHAILDRQSRRCFPGFRSWFFNASFGWIRQTLRRLVFFVLRATRDREKRQESHRQDAKDFCHDDRAFPCQQVYQPSPWNVRFGIPQAPREPDWLDRDTEKTLKALGAVYPVTAVILSKLGKLNQFAKMTRC